jgi:hypothetical protein
LAIVVLHSITGVCTPACLSAASTSVEAVTPPEKHAVDWRDIHLDALHIVVDSGGVEVNTEDTKVTELGISALIGAPDSYGTWVTPSGTDE